MRNRCRFSPRRFRYSCFIFLSPREARAGWEDMGKGQGQAGQGQDDRGGTSGARGRRRHAAARCPTPQPQGRVGMHGHPLPAQPGAARPRRGHRAYPPPLPPRPPAGSEGSFVSVALPRLPPLVAQPFSATAALAAGSGRGAGRGGPGCTAVSCAKTVPPHLHATLVPRSNLAHVSAPPSPSVRNPRLSLRTLADVHVRGAALRGVGCGGRKAERPRGAAQCSLPPPHFSGLPHVAK